MHHDRLAPGFLLAAPKLGDPNFERTVVLLGRHDDEGSLGWVINGKSIGPMREVIKGSRLWKEGMTLGASRWFDHAVRVGGPVSPGSGWLIYPRQAEKAFEGEIAVGDSLAVTPDANVLAGVLRGEEPKVFRMVLGYSGWGPGQLEGEIKAGGWLPADTDAQIIFETGHDKVWNEAYQRAIGFHPAAFTSTRGGKA